MNIACIQVVRKPAWVDEAVITDLLHACFAEYKDMALHFAAVSQTPETTRAELESAEAFVALDGEKIAGVVMVQSILEKDDGKSTPCTYLKKLAVLPEYRGNHLADRLIDEAEKAFPESKYLVLDTAMNAERLVSFYRRRGFEIRKYFCWENTNYVSVQMWKKLKTDADGEPVYACKPVAFYVANMVQMYAVLPLMQELTEQEIEFDIIVPEYHKGELGWESIWESTYTAFIHRGFLPRVSSEINERYRVILVPYNNEILQWGDCVIRYRYSVVTKPEFSYRLDNTLLFDCILCYGSQDARAFSAYTRTLKIGNPRSEGFIQKPAAGKRRVLYAPTYHAGLDFDRIADILEKLRKNYHITLKLHPGSEFLDDENEMAKQLRSSCDECIHGNEDIMRLLETTDLLISDYSGAVFDAMSVGVPVAVVRAGDRIHATRDGSVLNNLITDGVIPCCYCAEDMEDTVRRALSEELRERQSTAAADLFSIRPEDGKKAFVSLIQGILKEGGTNSDYMMERHRLARNMELMQTKLDALTHKLDQLRYKGEEQNKEIECLKQQNEKLRKEYEQLDLWNQNLDSTLKCMEGSTSWRMTKPLREIGRKLRGK